MLIFKSQPNNSKPHSSLNVARVHSLHLLFASEGLQNLFLGERKVEAFQKGVIDIFLDFYLCTVISSDFERSWVINTEVGNYMLRNLIL